jgi:predicted Fe-Mo cluster-binding NifX family protein
MTTKIVIPIEEPTGLNAPVAQNFGGALYYTIIELNPNKEPTNITTQKNNFDKSPQEAILDLCPTTIITKFMNLAALTCFQNAGVQVLKAEGITAHQVLLNYREGILEEIINNP